MLTAIDEFLSTSQPCLFLVHPDFHSLNDAARKLLSQYGWPRLSVGKELSAALLPEVPRRHSIVANRWTKARLDDVAPGPVLCTEIDLLFNPELNLDPLRLFRNIGRTTRLVVTWPGTFQGDILAYAVPEHTRYRTWRNPRLPIVTLR